MIHGEVTATLDAVIPIQLRGTNGVQREITAVLDTGFNDYLTLPMSLIRELGLAFGYTLDVHMADQRIVPTDIYPVTVHWQSEERIVPAQVSEGEPLVGMMLLLDNLLTIQVRHGGSVAVDPLP